MLFVFKHRANSFSAADFPHSTSVVDDSDSISAHVNKRHEKISSSYHIHRKSRKWKRRSEAHGSWSILGDRQIFLGEKTRFLGERNGRDFLRERKRGELVTKSMGVEWSGWRRRRKQFQSFCGIFHCVWN